MSAAERQRMIDDMSDSDDETIMMMILTQKKKKFVHSRNRHVFTRSLTVDERRLRSHYIPRCALQDPLASAFSTLFRSNNDQALITVTGFHHASFNYLLERFSPVFESMTPYGEDGQIREKQKKGRPRTFDNTLGLGLVLMWTRTRGSCFVLGMLYGSTKGPLSLFLRFGRRVLLQVLRADPASRIKIPDTREEVDALCESVAAKYPVLGEKKVCYAMDGLKLTLEQSPDVEIQARFYNGWTHDHYVTNVFLFFPDGTIGAMVINGPGCMHDSTMCEAGGLYKKCTTFFEKFGVRGVVDSAFATKNVDHFIQSAQTPPATGVAEDIIIYKEATSVRQLSEWGMRSLQGGMPRIKDTFYYEERGERGVIIEMVIRLFNIRARLVGISQIRTTFMPNLALSANAHFNV